MLAFYPTRDTIKPQDVRNRIETGKWVLVERRFQLLTPKLKICEALLETA